MDRSTLDMVTTRIAALKSRLGRADQIKLDQYLDSIRDVERRIQIAERTDVKALPQADRPAGVLRVLAAYAEPCAPPHTASELLDELRLMQGWLGLERLEVRDAGDLGPALAVYQT
jgi:hypothetical protein